MRIARLERTRNSSRPAKRVRAVRVLTLLALCGIPFFSLAAQQNRDSVDTRRRAVRAQARFEQVRRQNLPRRYSGSGGNCDARIGRFCQYNSEDDTIEAKDPRTI